MQASDPNRLFTSSRRRAVLVGACAIASYAALAQEPDGAVMQAASTSIGRVVANDCGDSTSRTGTAFLWRDKASVVTARHVVAGCSDVQIYFGATGAPVAALPERELRTRDLALLRLVSPSAAPPLKRSPARPAVGAKLAAIGFPLGTPTIDNKILNVTLANAPPGARLADVLPDNMREAVEASGDWNLQTSIYRLDGNLLPGHSGAPVIDRAGRVVGVGSGGLQNGAGGIVWAVDAAYLDELNSAPKVTTIEPMNNPGGIGFAFQQSQSRLRTVTCGASSFAYSRTATLAELFAGSDDQLGLQQLAMGVGAMAGAQAQPSFDIWVDRQSGASISVPRGAIIRPEGSERCRVAVGPRVEMLLTSRPVTGTTSALRRQQVQTVSLAFENHLAGRVPGPLSPDPAWTYPQAMTRSDGFDRRRLAAEAKRQSGEWNVINSDYIFVTHMTRGNRYFGVAALRKDFPFDLTDIQACMAAPNGEKCASGRNKLKDWSQSALAVHLATIPPI